ncbi:hypothetical protein MKMG_02104 [Methanogenium sp. MK-MG]|nr:hypothetical protein MKMG_02104 [Methanogenium sp. MK-MG]
MVCGQSLKKRYMMQREVAVVAVLVVVAILLAYLLFPVFFGATTVTSTGNVRFVVTLSDGSASIEYGGSADGRDVADLQIAILAEDGRSSQRFSFADPQPGTVLGPVETGTVGKPVGIYYVAVYADGTEINNTIPI